MMSNFGQIMADGIQINIVGMIFSENQLTVTTYITAPKKGDQAIELLGLSLQKAAEQLNISIKHVGTPGYPAAEKLYKRAEEKGLYEYDKRSHSWVREFSGKDNGSSV